MSMWERFDNIATPDEVNEAKNSFKPVEAGKYHAVLEEIEAGESKESHLPMMKLKFRLDNNRLVFVNQILQSTDPSKNGWMIGQAVAIYEGIIEDDYEYKGLVQFAKDLKATPVGTEHIITISYGNKDLEQKFPKVKVSAIPLSWDSAVSSDEDIPF